MHFRLMHLIEKNPQVSQREIAVQLGVSLGGINYCIKALIEKGYVKVSNFKENPSKLGYAYLLTPKGILAKTALTGRFLKRKIAEYDALKAEIDLLQGKVLQTSVQPKNQSGQQRVKK
jgi:EPS-associated MarR family transcriptional regulator